MINAYLLTYHNSSNKTEPETKRLNRRVVHDEDFYRLCAWIVSRSIVSPWQQINIVQARRRRIVFILSCREVDKVNEVSFRHNRKWFNMPVNMFKARVLKPALRREAVEAYREELRTQAQQTRQGADYTVGVR